MPESVAFDPKTKKFIKDSIYLFLYGNMESHYEKRLMSLIVHNSTILKNGQYAFIYKGEKYGRTEKDKCVRPLNRLHKSLHSEMDEYLMELNHLNAYEIPYVMNYINQVLNSTDSFQDYYRLFPESMHQPLREIAQKCPCSIAILPDSRVTEIRDGNTQSIDLIRKRLTQNLLLT